VNNPLEARKSPGIAKHALPEKGPINPAVSCANARKRSRYRFYRTATWRQQPVDHVIGIEHR
jgi:hypothetical protein